MEKWQSAIDRAIQEALQNGELSNLPGQGKPLNLTEDSNIPDDMRVAYKIMAQNGIAPEWIELGKYLEAREKQIHTKLRQAVKYHQEALADVKKISPEKAPQFQENAEKVWQSTQRSLKRVVDEYNDQILSFNLKAPRTVKQRYIFDLQREINKLMGR